MKKRTFIIFASVVLTILLGLLFWYRMNLIRADVSGFYTLVDDPFTTWMTYLPEIAIICTIITIYVKRFPGVMGTIVSTIITISAFIAELFIVLIKSVDPSGIGKVPTPCRPWLNIPVFIICIILFIVKFKIFVIPKDITFKF